MEKASTKRLDLIPDIYRLEKLLKSIIALDFVCSDYYGVIFECHILSDKSRTYSFTNQNNYFNIFFDESGCIILGNIAYSRLYPIRRNDDTLSVPGVIDFVPIEFSKYLKYYEQGNYNKYYDENRNAYEITFCIWRKYTDSEWKTGNLDYLKLEECYEVYPEHDDFDGSETYLSLLDGNINSYIEWVKYLIEDSYISNLDLDFVKYVFDYNPLSDDLIKKYMNPKKNFDIIKREILRLGYPFY
jgi:hypothetical protein